METRAKLTERKVLGPEKLESDIPEKISKEKLRECCY